MERLIGFDAQLLHDAVITGINIFILFFGLSYLLFNPVRDVLEKRKQRISDELADAASNQERAAALKSEYEDKLKLINKEAENIFEEARRKAKNREAEIINEAKDEALKITERAYREIELEKKKAMADMKQEVIEIATLLAGKVVSGSIDLKAQNSLFEQTLNNMEDSTWQS